jgi:ParB family chromosome partitioning protein
MSFNQTRYNELIAKKKLKPSEKMELARLKEELREAEEAKFDDNKPSLIRSESVKARQMSLNIYEILPHPDQPRKHFRKNELETFAKGIKKEGLIQPIAVSLSSEGKITLIAGQKRLEAFKLENASEQEAGLKDYEMKFLTIPALVFEDKKEVEQNLIENTTKSIAENLSRAEPFVLDTAVAIASHYGLMKAVNPKLSQEAYAKEIKDSFCIESRSTIAKYLSIAKMEEELKKAVYEYELNAFTVLYQISKSKDSLDDKIELVRKASEGEIVLRDFENSEKTPESVEQPADDAAPFEEGNENSNSIDGKDDFIAPSFDEEKAPEELGESFFAIKNKYSGLNKIKTKQEAISYAEELVELLQKFINEEKN